MSNTNQLDSNIRLTDSKAYIEYWDSFIYEDWHSTIVELKNLGIDYQWKTRKMDEGIYFPKSNWIVFPRKSWKILPEPYFGNTCENDEDYIKGLFINLNPFCSKEQEDNFKIEDYLATLPYYYKDIYEFGKSYNTLNNLILEKHKKENSTYEWMRSNRSEWLSKLLHGKKGMIDNSKILAMEIIPWHSHKFRSIEKNYILNHSELIFNKTILPAVYYSNKKIPSCELLHATTICRGADISHLFENLIENKKGRITKINQERIFGGNKWECNIYLVQEENIGQTLFFVFQGIKGMKLPSISHSQLFEIPDIELSTKTTTELIIYFKQKCLTQ